MEAESGAGADAPEDMVDAVCLGSVDDLGDVEGEGWGVRERVYCCGAVGQHARRCLRAGICVSKATVWA